MKYLGMICRGHLPCIARHKVHPESKKFLQLFLAKGEPPDRGNLLKAARGLHLAFKGMQTEEIYAVLTEWPDLLHQAIRSVLQRQNPAGCERDQQKTGRKKVF